jgi:putative iron-only hydrogenase system regulator
MERLTIMGLRLDHRKDIAPKVQEVLTKYGDKIMCRMGLPDSEKQEGIITLYMKTSPKETEEFSKELEAIEGVSVSHMVI